MRRTASDTYAVERIQPQLLAPPWVVCEELRVWYPRTIIARGILGAVLVGPMLASRSARAEQETYPAVEVNRKDLINIDVRTFGIVASESGPVNYYRFVESPSGTFVRAEYVPPSATSVLGYEIPDEYKRKVASIRWRWRALVLPRGGNECAPKVADSAAVLYVTWRRGLRWYTLKYVWSADAPKGVTCDSRRNLFSAQDTIVVESGAPLGEWKSVEIDPDKEFRAHFAHGDPAADVPKLLGIGIMTDGDQTNSPSSADYGGFSLTVR